MKTPGLFENLALLVLCIGLSAIGAPVAFADDASNAANAQQLAASDKIDAAITAAAKTAQSATKAADLDDPITSLAQLQEATGQQGRDGRLQHVRQFLLSWQDYLAYVEQGNFPDALKTLQSAKDNDESFLIPRSHILAAIGTLSHRPPPQTKPSAQEPASQPTADAIKTILAKTTTLDAIPAAQDALAGLQPRAKSDHDSDNPCTATANELAAIFRAYQCYKAGLPCKLSFKPENDEAFTNTLPLRIQLLRLVIPQILGMDPGSKPDPNESIQKYLNRTMAAARQSGDAHLIGRVQELQDALDGNQGSSAPSLAFLNNLQAAHNQEAAGQFTPAVISYEATLASGGNLAPTEAIGARLDAIKKGHPQEYDKAMQLFLTNPPPGPGPYSTVHPADGIIIPGNALGKPAASAAPAQIP
jgi:hypothetical protein